MKIVRRRQRGPKLDLHVGESRHRLTKPLNMHSVRAGRLSTVVRITNEREDQRIRSANGPEQSVDKGGCTYGPIELFEERVLY